VSGLRGEIDTLPEFPILPVVDTRLIAQQDDACCT
jgi:hypothetical protein